jgi:hypothetical protein
MSDRPRLLDAIREADRTLASVHLTANASHRIRTAIREHGVSSARTRAAVWVVPAAVGAVALLVALAMGAPQALSSKSAEIGKCVTSASPEGVALKGACTMHLGAMDIETSGAARLSETSDGVHVLAGTAIFRVRPVPAGHEPVRIRVGGGVIEVIGTKFVIEQHAGGGTIELLEGTVRFISSAGKTTILHAGERLSWVDETPAPLPAGSPVAADSSGARPLAGAASNDDEKDLDHTLDGDEQPRLKAAIRRFIELRREARYTEEEHLRGELEPASFELGNALESAHAAPSRVCAHWRWHLARFEDGIYNGAIEQKARKLACPLLIQPR